MKRALSLVLPLIPPGVPRSLLWALGLSMALHAALLLGFVRPRLTSSVSNSVSALQARLVVQTSSAVMTSLAVADNAAASTTPAPLAAAAQTLAAAKTERHDGVAAVAVAPAPPAAAEETGKRGLQPAPDYRAALGLDPPPRPMHSIDPEYPVSAQLQEGTVVLRVLISSSGDVDEVAVVRATPPGVFEQSALQAFGKAKFSPGYFLGIPVKSQLFIEVGYTPINRGGAVSGQSR